MKKNRKMTKRMSVTARTSMRFGGVLVVFSVMVILNILSSASRNQLLKAKGALESQLADLEEARTRESTHWEEMKVPEKIEQALLRHGLRMNLPRPEQTVRMGRDGQPLPGQYSLAKARQRGALNEKQSAKYRRAKRKVGVH